MSESSIEARKAQQGSAKWWSEILTAPSRMEQFKRLETQWLSAERAVQIFCTDLLMRKPEVGQSTMTSIVSALCTCIASGLEPGTYVHFVVYNVKDPQDQSRKIQVCQPIIDYKGLIRVLYRSPLVKSVSSVLVFDGDKFEYYEGDDDRIIHTPDLEAERSMATLRYVYAIVKLTNGGIVRKVMTKQDVDDIRQRSRSAESGPWQTDPFEMARKCPIRNLNKYLPLDGYDISEAVEAIDATEREGYDFDKSEAARPAASPEQPAALPAPASRQQTFKEQIQAGAPIPNPNKPAEAAMAPQTAPEPPAARRATQPSAAPRNGPPPGQPLPQGRKPVPAGVEISEDDIPF